jgi:GNAT superfamily N-acetyltransferase
MIVRQASPTDAQGILDCLRLAFEPYREQYTPKGFDDTILSAETIGKRLTEMTVFVAVNQAGEIIGTVGCQVTHADEGHIRGMAVRPDHVGSGVAQRLLETVELELRRRGCSRISLDTTEPLARAMRFYERNGFRRTGVVRDFFGMPLLEYVKRWR